MPYFKQELETGANKQWLDIELIKEKKSIYKYTHVELYKYALLSAWISDS
jgi:hypothetical protein